MYDNEGKATQVKMRPIVSYLDCESEKCNVP